MNLNSRGRNQTTKRILNKNATKKDNKIIITSEVEEELTLENLKQAKREIESRKEKIKFQNKQLIEQFKQLEKQELEIDNYIDQLSEETEESIEQI